MNVKSAFLNGTLEEKVYVDQPPSFVGKKEEKVCILEKSLYRLKEAPRAWNSIIDGYLTENEFVRCPYEHSLYMKINLQGKVMFVCLYIDYLSFTHDDFIMIQDFKQSMMKEFEMIDLGLMTYFLGIKVKLCSNGIFISQIKYAANQVCNRGVEEVCYERLSTYR